MNLGKHLYGKIYIYEQLVSTYARIIAFCVKPPNYSSKKKRLYSKQIESIEKLNTELTTVCTKDTVYHAQFIDLEKHTTAPTHHQYMVEQ